MFVLTRPQRYSRFGLNVVGGMGAEYQLQPALFRHQNDQLIPQNIIRISAT
ncbi:MAG TPA: hypothetical protein VGA99_09720 [bacterium]